MNTLPLNILLVEDNPGDVFLIKQLLKQTEIIKFKLIHVDFLQKAIANLKQETVDIILLDLILPDSEGINTLLKIQTIAPHLPVILLTGIDDLELANQALSEEAQDYLLKDQINGELLARSIRYAIQRKQSQQQLKQHILELEGFNYMVSHELRSPLANITMMSEILEQKDTHQISQEQEKIYRERIAKSCSRMEETIEGLSTLSQINHQKLRIGLVNISNLVRQIVNQLQQQPERQVEFTIAPKLMTHGDSNLLKIALENLLHNAWKYTEEQEQPQIEFGTSSGEIQGQKLHSLTFPTNSSISQEQGIDSQPVYFVRDNGVGFDTQYANNLFIPFQRLHDRSQFPGAGIGLATVQRIIKQHGGKIWFDAAINRGATFYFILGEY